MGAQAGDPAHLGTWENVTWALKGELTGPRGAKVGLCHPWACKSPWLEPLSCEAGMEAVMMGHVARCLSRLWQGWVTRMEDVAFFLRVVGSHWCFESRGVNRI